MQSANNTQVTKLLRAWHGGDEAALAQLTPLVYGELRRLAHGYLRGERAGHMLQTTALINEAYLRLFDWQHVEWQDRAHFIAIAAQMMRRVLVDFARARHYAKRGGQAQQVEFDETLIAAQQRDTELIALDEALQLLGEVDPRKCHIVELRYFGGLSVEETAEALQLSTRTVIREWKLARAWLYRELRNSDLKGTDEN